MAKEANNLKQDETKELEKKTQNVQSSPEQNSADKTAVKLTQEGYDKLKEELVLLRSEKRSEIAAKLEEARGFGDLSENAEYHAAKEEQEKLENRILQLESQLAKAQIIKEIDTSVVGLGTIVTLEEKKKNFIYKIVSTEEADFNAEPKKISASSPVGQALIGKSRGETVNVRTPRGDTRKLKIVSIAKDKKGKAKK